MKFCLLTILLFSGCLLSSQNRGAITETSDNTEKDGITRAIIIGISDYKEVSDLKFADKDATVFYNYLQTNSGGNVDEENIKIFLNEDATASKIGNAFLWLAQNSVEGDRAIIYFAGHGDTETLSKIDNGLLLLYNAPKESYFSMGNDYLAIHYLKNIIYSLTERHIEVIVIADACHSGTLSGGVSGENRTLSSMTENWSNEIKILSCQPNEFSQEGEQWGGGRGIFSFYLIHGLIGLADKNNDGNVNLFELESYIVENVTSGTSQQQIPFSTGIKSTVLSSADNEMVALIKDAQENEYNLLSAVTEKGQGEKLLGNDEKLKGLYKQFQKQLSEGNLLAPEGESAYDVYLTLCETEHLKPLTDILKLNLAASLQDEVMKILLPLLNGKTVYTEETILEKAIFNIDKSLELLGPDHYINNSLKARKLFIESVILTMQYKRSGDIELLSDAEKKLTNSLNLEPTGAYSYLQLGNIKSILKDAAGAEENYLKYIEFVPNDPFGYYNLGNNYIEKGDLRNALISLEKAAELDPVFVNVFSSLGVVYEKNGNIEKAESYYNKAISINDQYIPASFNLAGLYYDTGRFEESLELYEKVKKADAEYNGIDYATATVHEALGNFEQALKHYDLSYQKTRDPYILYLKGVIYINNLKNYTKAISLFNEGLKKDPGKYYYYEGLGYCYLNLKEYKNALSNFQKAIELNKSTPYNYYNIAVIYSIADKKAEALEWLEKAFINGFNDSYLINNDSNLSNIKYTEEFYQLIIKYNIVE